MADQPKRRLNMSIKKGAGYINIGSVATWDDVKYRWSIKIDSLRELLTLFDAGHIEAKNGYLGGNCSEFGQVKSVQMELPNISKTNKNNVNSDNIPF
jgi:hypothetical protein